MIKKETTMKDLNKEVKVPEIKKIKSEKENEYGEEKWAEVENTIQKSKTYLQAIDLDDENDD